MAKEKSKQKNIVVACGIIIAVCVCIIIGLLIYFTGNNTKTDTSSNKSKETATKVTKEYDEVTIDASLTYYADIDIKDYGTITVKLDQKTAPATVENFVALAESGFYDGLTFHRIIENFMMQGGDPNGNGTGGAEKQIAGEFTANGYENNLSHTRGAISMARSNDYNSASSQFFIVHKDSPYLDGEYAVFGYVTEGMGVVDKVCETAVPTDANGTIASDDQPVITSISIRTE